MNGAPPEVPAAKNLWGLRPLGFWLWDSRRGFIHHDTRSAFPHIVPVYTALSLQRSLPAYARVKQARVPNAYDPKALRLEVSRQQRAIVVGAKH